MKTFYFVTPVLVGLTLAFSSCDNGDDNQRPLPDADPIVLRPEYDAKTFSNRSFAIDLFKTTVAESDGDNLFISPYSVNTALNMLWNGAAGSTEQEMRTVLGNGTYAVDQINDYAKTLTDALLKVDRSTDIRIANSIWADNSFPFRQSFVQVNSKWYDAAVKNVDFANRATLDDIDRWCRDNTAGKIDRISEGMSPDTKFALINAVYFKAKWKNKFDKSKTRDDDFVDHNGARKVVEMMNQREDFLYGDDDSDWKMLSLSYGNRAFSMVVLMPYTDEPLDRKIETLTADKYYELLDNLNTYTVTVKMPKFKAEYSYELHENILPSMGMRKVFDPLTADLSGMCDTPMFVNMVMHKTYIDVYEEGTEAAAATSVSGVCTSVGPGTPLDFFMDRPFIFSIVENSTGTILFMGRINSF